MHIPTGTFTKNAYNSTKVTKMFSLIKKMFKGLLTLLCSGWQVIQIQQIFSVDSKFEFGLDAGALRKLSTTFSRLHLAFRQNGWILHHDYASWQMIISISEVLTNKVFLSSRTWWFLSPSHSLPVKRHFKCSLFW